MHGISSTAGFYQIGTAGVNALLQQYDNTYIFAFPPVAMLTAFLTRILAARSCRLILVAPVWQGNAFWNLLCPDGIHASPIVRAWHRLALTNGDIIPGLHGRPDFIVKPTTRRRYEFVAFFLDTSQWPLPRLGRPFCTVSHFRGHCNVCAQQHNSL